MTRIAYFVNQYPQVSHTFIRREIVALEKLGFQVLRFALRGWDAVLVDEEDVREQSRTAYLLREGRFRLLVETVRMLLCDPLRFARALAYAARLAWNADRALPYHLAYFAEACVLVTRLSSHGVSHVHAHFGTNSAEVVMLAHLLGGPAYSFTVHGPEEFEKAHSLHLSEKIAHAAFVTTVSWYGHRALMQWAKKCDWDKIHVVHCGLDPASYPAPSRPPSTARFACIGRICEQKAQSLLVDAFARLIASGLDAELILVGDGETRMEVEARITKHRLADRVHITGWVDGARVSQELAQSRALVLPSLAEGLPVVIMESMAIGRAVISTKVAGIPELVIDGETGWLVPPGNCDALVEAMAAALSCPTEKLAAMGERARARVFEHHSIQREAAKLAALMRLSGSTA